jgi:hypothetical protein
MAACEAAGIACFHIGTAVANAAERLLLGNSGARPLPMFARDEIVNLFQEEG